MLAILALLPALAAPSLGSLALVSVPDTTKAGRGDVVLSNLGQEPFPITGFDLVGPTTWAIEPAAATLQPGATLNLSLSWTAPGKLPVQVLVRTEVGTLVVRPDAPRAGGLVGVSGSTFTSGASMPENAGVLGVIRDDQMLGGLIGAPSQATVGVPAGVIGANELANPPQASSPSEGGAAVGGAPIILGALDKSLIDGVIKKHMNQIRYCYQRDLTKDPALKGKVSIKFVIARDGTVSSSSVKTTTLPHGRVEACIAGRFADMVFPEPTGGGVVIVSYPFIFSPG